MSYFGLYNSVESILFCPSESHLASPKSLSLCVLAVMTTDPGSVPTKALPLLDDEVENEYALAEECRDTRVPYKKYCRRCKVTLPATFCPFLRMPTFSLISRSHLTDKADTRYVSIRHYAGIQAAACTPLQYLWALHREDGPPLPVSSNCL